MFLKSLNLQNFRIFKKKSFEFKKPITLIVGPNAIGKTSLLEAIYLLATGKSFRAKKEEEMIGYGEEMARINGELDSLDLLRSETKFDPVFQSRAKKIGTTPSDSSRDAVNTKTLSNLSPSHANLNKKLSPRESLEIILTTGEVQGKRTARKLYKLNGVGKHWRDFAGQLKVVIFRPEDIDLILGPPSLRRDFLDEVLEAVDWQYRGCHLAYKKGLRQRNKLLDRIREGKAQSSQLTFWNQLLIKNGEIITQKRQELIDFFNEALDDLEIFYDKSVMSQERLAKYQEAELALGATLVGPHRDDVAISKIERNLALFGSRGEQRMAVLKLKLAQLEFLKEKTQELPVLLLDDIFSELDKKHRQEVLKIINSCQVIITSTAINKELLCNITSQFSHFVTSQFS